MTNVAGHKRMTHLLYVLYVIGAALLCSTLAVLPHLSSLMELPAYGANRKENVISLSPIQADKENR